MLATCPDTRLRDPRRAVTLAEQAVRLLPTFYQYWTILGTAGIAPAIATGPSRR